MSGAELLAIAALVPACVSAFGAIAIEYRSWRKRKVERSSKRKNIHLKNSLVESRAAVQAEYDDRLDRLGSAFRRGDEIGRGQLKDHLIYLQTTVIQLLMSQRDDFVHLVHPQHNLILNDTTSVRDGIVTTLMQQYQRLEQAKPISRPLSFPLSRPPNRLTKHRAQVEPSDGSQSSIRRRGQRKSPPSLKRMNGDESDDDSSSTASDTLSDSEHEAKPPSNHQQQRKQPKPFPGLAALQASRGNSALKACVDALQPDPHRRSRTEDPFLDKYRRFHHYMATNRITPISEQTSSPPPEYRNCGGHVEVSKRYRGNNVSLKSKGDRLKCDSCDWTGYDPYETTFRSKEGLEIADQVVWDRFHYRRNKPADIHWWRCFLCGKEDFHYSKYASLEPGFWRELAAHLKRHSYAEITGRSPDASTKGRIEELSD